MSPAEIKNIYHTPAKEISWISRHFPNPIFYKNMVSIIVKAAGLAKKGRYSGEDWIVSSQNMMKALENVGVKFHIENLEVLNKLKSPCVIVGNHMSVLETLVLPGIIHPHQKFTFVVKKGLMDYPVFKHIMISRNPIFVDRVNPRTDLKNILSGGQERLSKDISIMIFPQTTRIFDIDPKTFNSIGVKLARRAEVPLIPLALKTDAWGIGTWVKDFGKINPAVKVHFSFGEPMTITGNGKHEHEKCLQYISDKLEGFD